jgi:hypothetical protein
VRITTRAQAVAAFRVAADLARAQGEKVTFWPGWATRGRDGLQVYVVVEHDTADPAILTRQRILDILANGHGSIAGNAICTDAVMRDGEIVVIASGLAWHAGSSTWRGRTSLNRWSLGTEYHRAGSQSLTDAQMRAGRVWTRARLAAFGLVPADVGEHAEVALPDGRKGDRSASPGVRVNGAAWRRSLAVPDPEPEPELTWLEELLTMSTIDRQKLIDDIAAAAATAVHTRRIPTALQDSDVRADSLLARAADHSVMATRALAELPTDVLVQQARLTRSIAAALIAAYRREARRKPDPKSDQIWVQRLTDGTHTTTDARRAFGLPV